MTPRQMIRVQCLHCVGGSFRDVLTCDGDGKDPAYHACPFHPYRMSKGRASAKVVRRVCLQCMGGSAKLVRDCNDRDCFCHPFRMGKNPHLARKGRSTDELRAIGPNNPHSARGKAVYFERSATGRGIR